MKKIYIFIFLYSSLLFSQKEYFKITGQVVDENNVKVAYTNVSISSTNIGTICNSDGVFELVLTKDLIHDTVEFSTIGFKTYNIK